MREGRGGKKERNRKTKRKMKKFGVKKNEEKQGKM